MEPLEICFGAFDVGPGKNLAMIANAAAQRAHRVSMAVNGAVIDLNFPVRSILVTGLSSFQNGGELVLGKIAGEIESPWVVIADTHRSWGREAAKGKVGNAIAVGRFAGRNRRRLRFRIQRRGLSGRSAYLAELC